MMYNISKMSIKSILHDVDAIGNCQSCLGTDGEVPTSSAQTLFEIMFTHRQSCIHETVQKKTSLIYSVRSTNQIFVNPYRLNKSDRIYQPHMLDQDNRALSNSSDRKNIETFVLP